MTFSPCAVGRWLVSPLGDIQSAGLANNQRFLPPGHGIVIPTGWDFDLRASYIFINFTISYCHLHELEALSLLISYSTLSWSFTVSTTFRMYSFCSSMTAGILSS